MKFYVHLKVQIEYFPNFFAENYITDPSADNNQKLSKSTIVGQRGEGQDQFILSNIINKLREKTQEMEQIKKNLKDLRENVETKELLDKNN